MSRRQYTVWIEQREGCFYLPALLLLPPHLAQPSPLLDLFVLSLHLSFSTFLCPSLSLAHTAPIAATQSSTFATSRSVPALSLFCPLSLCFSLFLFPSLSLSRSGSFRNIQGSFHTDPENLYGNCRWKAGGARLCRHTFGW